MPFITEEIYSVLVPEEESLMMSEWPQFHAEWDFPAEENVMEHVKEITRGKMCIRDRLRRAEDSGFVKGRNIHSESWSRWHRKQNRSIALSIRMHRSSFRHEMYRSVFVSSAAEPDRKYRRRLVRSCAVSTRVWL